MRAYLRLAGLCSIAASFVASLGFPAPAHAQTPSSSTFKVAFYNIQSGKGVQPLPGFPSTFGNTTNCTDASKPLSAWGVGLVQRELVARVAQDPDVVALGLAEAWPCATPAAVKTVLGWRAASSEQNGVAIVARYGFAGPEQWLQLDTTLNTSPRDTMWVLRIPVCLDAGCTRTFVVFTAHWSGTGLTNADSNAEVEIQAQQSLDFMSPLPPGQPYVLIGDLNVFAGTRVVCSQNPKNKPLQMMRDAGYVDGWSSLNGPADGSTGMWNRAGCGTPQGNLWKRIDYAWSKNVAPVSFARFGMVTPGNEAPSDHAGIIAEYSFPGVLAASVPPTIVVTSPVEGAAITGPVSVTVNAQDDDRVTRVEFLLDGAVQAVSNIAPFDFNWNASATANGIHTLQAAATDVTGNRTVSAPRIVNVQNPVAAGDEVVLYGVEATAISGNWQLVADAGAAGRARLQNPDAGAALVTAPLAQPASYAELTFNATAGKPYRLWLRAAAENDSTANDEVYVQFSNAVDASGVPLYRIGTATAATVILEDCDGCGLSGWGWQDNGWPRDVLGPVVYFAASGTQRLRLQAREDGIRVDQVVLSSLQYLTRAPGDLKDDHTILAATSGLLPDPGANVPPAVALTSPAANTTVLAPATVALTATATDSDGTVARVDFFAGPALVATSTAAPFGASWSSVAAGTYSLTARAVDNAGAMTISAPVILRVSAPNTPPSVALSSPATGSSYVAPATIVLAATASDADDGVASVQFFAGAIALGAATSAPYGATWSGAAPGQYSITAVATDVSGARTTSSPVLVVVGAAVVPVPAVVGLTQAAATSAITAAGLTVGVVTISASATVPSGAVSSQLPVGGSSVTPASAVALVISSGPVVVDPGLPAPWSTQDVGAVGVAGSAAFASASGTYTVSGAGADIWGAADAFRYVYQPLTGDGQIVARVASVQNTNAWVKAGVMIRADLTAGSAQAMMMVTPGKGNNFQRRVLAGDLSSSTAGAMMTAPAWVKLARTGTLITAFQSADGTTWSVVGSATIPLPSAVLIGLAISSHSTTVRATATFDQVATGLVPPSGVNVAVPSVAGMTQSSASAMIGAAGLTLGAVTTASSGLVPAGSVVSQSPVAATLVTPGSTVALVVSTGAIIPPAGLPVPWLTQDVGTVGLAGSATFDSPAGAFAVTGAGADIWGTADAFRYVYQPFHGDGQIVARVAAVQNTNVWVKAGVMLRADLTPGSPHAMMMVTPGKGNNFQRRLAAGGVSVSTAGAVVAAPYWVKLVRSGSTISAYQSLDGSAWSLLGTATIPLPADILVGLAVSSHSTSTRATGTFDYVSVDHP